MIELTKIQTHHPEYSFVENLLHLSFPEIERRDDEAQRHTTDNNPAFGCYLITDCDCSKQPIGVITLWKLNGFIYAEHLATSPHVRNRGYGKQIMEKLKQEFTDQPIILEVERPEDDMSIRRIGFYERCGFSLCLKDYIQPPYRKGGKELPLYLMYIGTTNIDNDFERIRNCIHREVYGVSI